MTTIERSEDEPDVSAVTVADVALAGCLGCLFWLVGGAVMIVVGAWACC